MFSNRTYSKSFWIQFKASAQKFNFNLDEQVLKVTKKETEQYSIWPQKRPNKKKFFGLERLIGSLRKIRKVNKCIRMYVYVCIYVYVIFKNWFSNIKIVKIRNNLFCYLCCKYTHKNLYTYVHVLKYQLNWETYTDTVPMNFFSSQLQNDDDDV